MQTSKAKSVQKILPTSGKLIVKLRVKNLRSLFLLKAWML